MTISVHEYRQRQQRLLAAMTPNSLALISANGEVVRSRDTHFPFRQDSDFFYLCGFNEPDALLLLSNGPQMDAQVILFCRDKDPKAEIWEGRRIGPEQAEQDYAVDVAAPLDETQSSLLEIIDGHLRLYSQHGEHGDMHAMVDDILGQLRANRHKQAPTELVDVAPLIAEMRLIKSEAEIALMQRAADISVEAHLRALKATAAGVYEYQLAAELHHSFAMQGASGPAYGTIVGGGHNACILHYTENSAALEDGDLVLIDAGAEFHGYAADITRTFPVNGRFSQAQAELYSLVLKAQERAFELLKPGNTLKQAADEVIRILTQGLLDLGLLQGELDDNIAQGHYRRFYMHGLSHWLGLDVHDVGAYQCDGKDRPLAPGMVLTVEPGLYISDDAEVPVQYRGMGIRIEDNVVITETGMRNLTEAMPRDMHSIEALMQKAEQG